MIKICTALPGGAWAVQSLKHPTLNFSLDHNLRVRKSSLTLGSVLSTELGVYLRLSFSVPPSLSQVNK